MGTQCLENRRRSHGKIREMVIKGSPKKGQEYLENMELWMKMEKTFLAASFYEFVMVKTAPKMEEPEEKLRWIFQSFDKDGGGQIDDDEMYGVVVTLFKMMNKEVEDEELDDIVDDILEKVDANE